MNVLLDPWPWYIAGPLIAVIMFALLLLGKQFGMSSNLRTACAAIGAGKAAEFFKFDWKAERWNLMVVLGAVIGGFLAAQYMSDGVVVINEMVAQQLHTDYGITSGNEAYLPPELFASENLAHPFNIAVLFGGGLLVGFGARYAGGCTSGHAISGLSNLQLPSLIAVTGFFIGGLIMIHLIYPILF
jgi:uncharacterized membrane protein YedE/YeeE